jgi:hypothetical protein
MRLGTHVASTPEDFLRSVDEAKAERRRAKDAERSLDARPMDPWERYRALGDHYKHVLDEAEQSDRKTRFALLILGSLNAVNVIVVTKGDIIGFSTQPGVALSLYLACYAILSLYLFVHAISALRPRQPRGADFPADMSPDAFPPLRVADAVLTQTPAEYNEHWREVPIGHVNRELAFMAYFTTRGNARKLRSLHRVYVGLYVLVGITAALLLVLGATGLR